MGNQEKLYNLLKEAFLLLDFGDRQLFTRYNLTAPRFYALFHINQEPGISSTQLSDRMFCDKSNATRIIKGLEAEGYVNRQPHETDGRSLRLYLTEEGTAVCQQVVAAHQTYNQARLDCITDIEQGNLIQGLTRLNQRLQESLTKDTFINTVS
ncbi:MAG: MarR family transcriptional regulator [Ardenticatenaceae bacterium]|nr:MarR family transcriptional regulator [Ardenticatenaceae bacterium]